MAFIQAAEYKKPWALRFNQPRIDDIVNSTDELQAVGVSIKEIADVISVLEEGQHLDIMRDRQNLLPDSYGREFHPAYFMRDGDTINLKYMTKKELLEKGDPHQLIYEALEKYSGGRFRPVRGLSWMPYMGRRRAVVPTVYQLDGWNLAAGLNVSGENLKILNPRGKSVVEFPNPEIEIPSRRDDGVYPVRFSNLPVGHQAYAEWTLLNHVTKSDMALFAGMTDRSKLEQIVFGAHQVAAYLLRGMAHPLAAYQNTGKPGQVLRELAVLPFPPPSDELLAFYQNLGRVYNVHVNQETDRVDYVSLNKAEQQSLISAYMHSVRPDEVFTYNTGGRFDGSFVTSAFKRILEHYPDK